MMPAALSDQNFSAASIQDIKIHQHTLQMSKSVNQS